MNEEDLEITNCCLHCHFLLGKKNDLSKSGLTNDYYQKCDNCDTYNHFEDDQYSIVTFISKFKGNPIDVTWYKKSNVTIVTLISLSEDKQVVMKRDKVLAIDGHPLTPQNIEQKLPIYITFS